MKKVIALVMCIAMIACVAVTASAADYNVDLTLSSHKDAKVGDKLEVTVSISEGSDLGALEFNVDLDDEYLKPIATKDKRGNDQWFVPGPASDGASLVGSDGLDAESNLVKFAAANVNGYYDAGVVVTFFVEVIKELPAEGAKMDLIVAATTHYEDNTKTYEVKDVDGVVTPYVDKPSEVPPSSVPQSKPESKPESKPGTTVEPESKPAETDTDTNPATGDVTGIAVAAGLCAVMAAAFVITKKVND